MEKDTKVDMDKGRVGDRLGEGIRKLMVRDGEWCGTHGSLG